MIKETARVIVNRLANAVYISRSGKYFGACTPDHFVYIWDEWGKSVLKKQETSEITDFLILDNEEEFAYICGGKGISIISLKDEQIWNMKIDVSCFAVSSDGKLLSCGTSLSGDKNYLYIIDKETSGLLSRKKGKIAYKEKINTHCSTTVISPDGNKIAFGLANFEMLILDPGGKQLFSQKTKGPISSISFCDDGSLLVANSNGFLNRYSSNFEEIWSKQFKDSQNLIAKISGDGKVILANPMGNEILMLEAKGEIFWRIKPKYPAPRISINSDGVYFAFATSTDKSIRRYINESTGINSLAPFYVQKLVKNDDPGFAVKMLKECGHSAFNELINAIKEEKLSDIHLQVLAPILDTDFFKMLLDTFIGDYNNLPIIKAIDILNNYYDDMSQILIESMPDNIELYRNMLEKISEYAFHRESPSIYRLLGIIYLKLGDYSSSVKYLTESLMFEEIDDNTIDHLTQAQQNFMKEITLSKLKHDIYLSLSSKLFH